MDLKLQDKVIIVTGGARGIGEGIVRRLADEGAIPAIVDLNGQSAQALSEALRESGKQCVFAVADLTDPDQCKRAVESVYSMCHSIDGLVNNAGLNDGVGLQDGSYEQFVRSLTLNGVHYYTMTDLVLPYLTTGKGAIVNICSKVALTGQGGTSGYAAANGMRLELQTAHAAEMRARGLRCNAVVVAECATPQYEWWLSQQPDPEAQLQRINEKIPLDNRRTTPDEIAATTVFLLSEKSRSINAEYFHVDGGYVHLDRRVAAR
ncbi:SDR family oxidoreductase [Panacibacter sp. DH6]|uniref:SDR family oxidoreductase n=1 Tax=Panacibacter microcysteis TaxID=2793269 RepID=A0A931H0I9_9BACT|nr:SDR family oxidoreductase [Panacibacter microcysteis]MBG9378754.1 SDR family oxidoreductase [Panacibacter microcysteis]